VARAVVAVAEQAQITLADPSEFEEISGRGVRASVAGSEILVGRAKWVSEQGVSLATMSDAKYAEPEGLSTLYVAKDGTILGWIGLEDRTRPEARAALDQLREMGVNHLVMVTGDRWSVARRVAAEMGCSEVQAEVLPQDKLDLVAALKREGHVVAVIGDGVNDAPALAAGDLSVAMGAAGSDVAIHSASIALMNNDLGRLPFLLRLSRKATQVVHQNLLFGVGFISITLILGAMGYLKPIYAAVLHLLAAMIVIFNSARLVRFGEDLHKPAVPDEAAPAPRLEAVTAG
jgi:Cd2+/Zn2+-exporting ATPase